MDFNGRKNVLKKLINEKAKEMKENLAPFPDSPVKDDTVLLFLLWKIA
jgi:hypothetical protein